MIARRGVAALAVVWTAGAGGAAVAAPGRLTLHLPSQSYADSLIAIGVEGRLTLVGVANCAGRAPALSGLYTPREALTALLRTAPCRAQFVAEDTVVIVKGRPTPLPAPSPPPPAIARAAAAAQDLEQVVVTAQRRPELLMQAAGAVSVVDETRLNDVAALDVSDVSALLSSVVLTNLGPGRDKLVLRGVSDGAFTGRTRSTVATFLDDAPITYNAPDPDLVLVDVDRVEILPGPQGALYGGGSIGGVYRIATRAPQLDQFGGSLQLRGGLTQRGAGSWGSLATLNAPILTDRLGARVSVYDINSGGYLQDQNLAASNVDRTLRTGGRAALAAKLSPSWTMSLSAAVQHLVTADTQYTTLGTGAPSLRRANLVREGHKNDFRSAGLVVDGRIDELKLHASTSYVRHDFTSRYDASAALSLFDAPVADFGAYDETVRSEILSQDVYVSSPSTQAVSWLLGGSALRLSENTPSTLSARASGSRTPVTLYDEARRDRLDEASIYGEVRWRATPRLTLTADARAIRTSVDIDATTQTPRQRTAIRFQTDSASFSALSPKVSAEFAVTPSLNVYALASSGERPGGFNTGGLQAPTADRRAYASDRLANYEVGVKTTAWGGLADIEATVFHDRWRHVQTDQFYSSGLEYTANAGDGRLTGVEAAAGLRLFSRLKLEANALFTTSKIVDPSPLFAAGLQKGLPGAPQAAATLYAVWEKPLPHGADLLLSGRAGYVGHTRLTYDVTTANTTSASVIDADLSAQVLYRRYRLALTLSNPADSRADTFAYGNPFSFGQVRQATPQRPRTLEMVASASF